jgi:GH18 family chitinase
VEADTANFVLLVQELKQGLGTKGLTVTLPTSYWYLQHFDVNEMQGYVDWFVRSSLWIIALADDFFQVQPYVV